MITPIASNRQIRRSVNLNGLRVRFLNDLFIKFTVNFLSALQLRRKLTSNDFSVNI